MNQTAARNDAFRQTAVLDQSRNGQAVLTMGVIALGHEAVKAILSLVSSFSSFNKDNDPYHEHDFGCVVHNGTKIFWKIDDYGDNWKATLKRGPLILTIMLADEY